MGQVIDLTGQTFGRWTVVEYAGKNARGKPAWRCHCNCGSDSACASRAETVEHVVDGSSLRRGRSRSCGCLQRELTRDAFTKCAVSDDALWHWYVDKKMSTTDLARNYGVGSSTVQRWLVLANIPRRTRAQGVALKWTPERAEALTTAGYRAQQECGFDFRVAGRIQNRALGYPSLRKADRMRVFKARKFYTCLQCGLVFPGTRKAPRKFHNRECYFAYQRGRKKERLPQWLSEEMEKQALTSDSATALGPVPISEGRAR